jgi:hypothetical protein
MLSVDSCRSHLCWIIVCSRDTSLHFMPHVNQLLLISSCPPDTILTLGYMTRIVAADSVNIGKRDTGMDGGVLTA